MLLRVIVIQDVLLEQESSSASSLKLPVDDLYNNAAFLAQFSGDALAQRFLSSRSSPDAPRQLIKKSCTRNPKISGRAARHRNVSCRWRDAGLPNTPPADEMRCMFFFIVHRDYMCSLEQNDGKLVLFMIPGLQSNFCVHVASLG